MFYISGALFNIIFRAPFSAINKILRAAKMFILFA